MYLKKKKQTRGIFYKLYEYFIQLKNWQGRNLDAEVQLVQVGKIRHDVRNKFGYVFLLTAAQAATYTSILLFFIQICAGISKAIAIKIWVHGLGQSLSSVIF